MHFWSCRTFRKVQEETVVGKMAETTENRRIILKVIKFYLILLEDIGGLL